MSELKRWRNKKQCPFICRTSGSIVIDRKRIAGALRYLVRQKAEGKKGNVFLPHRGSKLTAIWKMLKNFLSLRKRDLDEAPIAQVSILSECRVELNVCRKLSPIRFSAQSFRQEIRKKADYTLVEWLRIGNEILPKNGRQYEINFKFI